MIQTPDNYVTIKPYTKSSEVNRERVAGRFGGKMVCVIGGGAAGPTSSKRSAIRNDE